MFFIKEASHIQGEVNLPGDKSIAHRAIILSAISCGRTKIENFPTNEDCLYTINAFKRLGIKVTPQNIPKPLSAVTLTICGRGLQGLRKPHGAIYVGESGTTLRLILGVLAGLNFPATLKAGTSLSKRPMHRVTAPLRMMGAFIKSNIKHPCLSGRQERSKIEEYPPIAIRGGELRAIVYTMPVPSAQVKSAILLAGLYAKGKTEIIEPVRTRDHTERMLRLFQADIKVAQNKIILKGGKELVSKPALYIPQDISSASFFMVLASILPNSCIRIKNVGLNPSRTGIIRVLKRMGADIKIKNQKLKTKNYEPMGDVIVKSSVLKGTRVKKYEIPSLIDELPILMVAGSVARGKTVFEGVGELRLKETDRIRSMSENLSKMGADIKVIQRARAEDIVIHGVKALYGAKVKSFGDHRTAMSTVVAGLKAKGKTQIDDLSCINKSFPNFLNTLKGVMV